MHAKTLTGVGLRTSCIALTLVWVCQPAHGQALPQPRILPSQQRQLPAEIETPAPAESLLPPAPLPAGPADAPTPRGLSVAVDAVEIEGNTVLEPGTLEAIVRSYVSRNLTGGDLLDLRRALNRAYADAGYATSFATIPDQDLAHGTLIVRIVEGRLVGVSIEGNERFRRSYIESRIAPHPDRPLNVHDLERRLQLLLAEPTIESVHARLSAGPRPGESVLSLSIVETRRWRAQVAVANDINPSIGGFDFRGGAGYSNLTGFDDDTAVTGAFSSGLDEVVGESSIPITRFDTRVGAMGRFSASRVVKGEFSDLDIRSRFWSFGLGVTQPIYRTLGVEWDGSVAWELRQSRNSLDGMPLDTSRAARDGRLRVSVFRLSTDVTARDARQVLAARTMFSIGAPVAGAWTTSDGVDDSSFVSWLGQLQWARRLSLFDAEILSRFDWQLAFDPLPPFERFGIGGINSVRGYAVNRLVRDNGFAGSVELRVPLLRYADGRSKLALAPFVDGGRSWFHDRGPTPDPQNLAGAGVGLLANPMPGVAFYFYWAAALIPVPEIESSLQDQGVYLGLRIRSW